MRSARPHLGLTVAALVVGCNQPAPGPQSTRAALSRALVAPTAQVVAAVVPTALAAVAEPTPAAEQNASSACPGSNMVLVEGDYCPNVEQNCRKWMDPPGRYEYFRCAEYAPATCKSKEKKHLRFCMDRDEYTPPGESLPANFKSWTHGDQICKSQGKRLCFESEYNFACEGEAMTAYPYGNSRDATACNADHFDVVGKDGKLIDRRAPSDAYPRCESSFGIRNLAGNLEEFVTIDGSVPARPAMKGAYWQPSRNHCRAAQTAHDRYYNGMETGFRCCASL